MPSGSPVLPDIVLIGATFLLTGFVKGVVGLALPTVEGRAAQP